MLSIILQSIIQGLTEFLPVSSSGHLLFIQKLTNFKGDELFFDVLLHIPTFLVILLFFSKDIINLFKEKWAIKFFIYLIIGNVPTAIIGIIINKFFGSVFENLNFLILSWSLTAIFLIVSDYLKEGNKSLKDINLKDALIIGFIQGVAVLPGISRAGSTIIAGIFCKIKREDSAKFSFLLGLPAISGAAILKFLETPLNNLPSNPEIITAITLTFISGLSGLILLIKLLKKTKLKIFGYYLLIMVLFLIILNAKNLLRN